MCTLVINDKPRIVAWTAPDNIGTPRTNRAARKKRKTVNKKTDRLTDKAFNVSHIEEPILSPQSGRTGIGRSCFTKKICESRIENGRTHRSGNDDRYKDRALRSSGSAKALASAAVW